MGHYINPGNENFKFIVNTNYIDKTGLIAVINDTINTEAMLSCVSLPRRFGKSYAANMLAAYYDCSCDSHGLFKGLEIEKDTGYEMHMNQYNVLYLDITGFMSYTGIDELPKYINQEIVKDINKMFPETMSEHAAKNCLADIVESTGRKFIAIIDEWDAPVRDSESTSKTQKDYLEFLRSLFKSEITKKVFAAAYMTGILPIKKDGSQSAISEFREYSMLKLGRFAAYAGFLEEDVKKICRRKNVSFEKMREFLTLIGSTVLQPIVR